MYSFLTVFIFVSFFLCLNGESLENEMEKYEENSIFLSCIYISRHFIKNVKREIESTMNSIDGSQAKVYDKIFLLLLHHCQKNLKFEDTSEVTKFF